MATSLSLGGDGAGSFGFDQVGDTVTGVIRDLDEVQQTDMKTGQPAFWDDGKPKTMYRVTLATDLRDPGDASDDGTRSVYLRGSVKAESKSSLAAVLAAVRDATGGGRDLKVGGKLTLTFSGEGQPSQKGWNPPKQYTAAYEPPSISLGGDQVPEAAPPAQPAAASNPATDPAILAALANLNPEALAALTAQAAK